MAKGFAARIAASSVLGALVPFLMNNQAMAQSHRYIDRSELWYGRNAIHRYWQVKSDLLTGRNVISRCVVDPEVFKACAAAADTRDRADNNSPTATD